MTATDDHKPEPWYWEANSDECPHGPEPEDDSPEWDEWMDRHTWAPQDVRICLDAPAGTACPACSAECGDMVPWSRCENRDHARPLPKTTAPQHRPVTVEVAGLECLERECKEFFTDDGDEIPGKETCSHFRQMEVCEACSETPPGDADPFPPVVAWADCQHKPVVTPK